MNKNSKYFNKVSRYQDLIYTSGITPRVNGKLIYQGKIDAIQDEKLKKEIMEIAIKNALNSIERTLEVDEEIKEIISFNCYINSDSFFSEHSQIANYASLLLINNYGISQIGCRAALGVNSLPDSSPVEIQLIVCVSNKIA